MVSMLMKNGCRIVVTPCREGSNGTRVVPGTPSPARRVPTWRLLPSLPFIAALSMLLMMQPALCEDAPTTTASPGSVTQEILEANIQEAEAATGIEEQAKSKLVELYRKALSNLQTASSNTQAAEDFRRAAETALAQVHILAKSWTSQTTRPRKTPSISPRRPRCAGSSSSCRRKRPISPRWMPGARTSRSGSKGRPADQR